MSYSTVGELGGIEDSVQLQIDGQSIVKATAWDVHEGILSQPAHWTLTLGSGDVAQGLIAMYPPRSRFQLYVATRLQQTGFTDGIVATQQPGGATTVTVKGRDALAPLQDTFVKAATGVHVTTYDQLVWYALQQVGLADPGQQTVDPKILAVGDNAKNRVIKAGVPIQAVVPFASAEAILEADESGNAGSLSIGAVATPPQAKVNETWHRFLRRYLDRAGLFLWAAADGSFVLAAPDGDQSPTYLLKRKTGQPTAGDRANVISMHYENDCTHRHSEAIVYGRGGGKAFGRVKSKGSFPDDEMQALGYFTQPIVYRDSHCKTQAEAAFFARRKLAEERRAGWRLEYTVSGHTLPFYGNNGQDVAVLIPDTVVAVDDDELGLKDNYYVESVDRRRSPQTTTTIRLMRIQDLIFGADEGED